TEQHHLQQLVVGQRVRAAGEQALAQPPTVAVVVRLFGRLGVIDPPAEQPRLAKGVNAHPGIENKMRTQVKWKATGQADPRCTPPARRSSPMRGIRAVVSGPR